MNGLIYKDLYLNRKSLRMIFLPFLLIPQTIMAQTVNNEPDSSVFMSILIAELLIMFFGYMNISGMMKYDENRMWASFVVSTPQSARGQVASKYYFALIILIGTFFLSYIYDILATAVRTDELSAVPLMTDLFSAVMLMVSVEIPFSIRFGSSGGNKYRAMLFLVIVLAAIVYFLFGDISIFGNIDRLVDRIIKFMNGEDLPGAVLILISLFPYFSAAMFYLSYRLSCRLYIKGIESLDE